MSKKSTRPVKINLRLESEAVSKAIEKVLETLCNGVVQLVPSTTEADLTIFDNARKVERDFSTEKNYIYLYGMMRDEKLPTFPENVSVIPATQVVVKLLGIVVDLHKKLQSASQEVFMETEAETKAPEIRPDAKRILVIDDTQKHIASAKKCLAGHHLVTATSYEEAMNILAGEKFEVVLTDLYLPMSSWGLSPEAFELGKQVPYGMLLMIEAARQGAKYVAVVTDLNHHSDPFSAAFDHYSKFLIQIEGAKVLMLQARVVDEEKDWANAFTRLLA